MSEDAVDQSAEFPRTPGERLRTAREAAGLSLADVGARTRVQQRHLEAIETDDFAALPSITYAVGFAKAYARAVGVDEVETAREIRTAMGSVARPTVPEYKPYQIEEPRRIAPRGLVIAGIIVAVLILIGAIVWFSGALGGSASSVAPAPEESAAPIDQAVPQATPAPTPSVAANGQVTLTATDQVWIRVYDADNKTLLLKTLQPGESYNVPANANHPMVNIGRPEKLNVTVNGVAVPPLGRPAHAIKNVEVSAAALAARGGAAVPAPAATAGQDNGLGNVAP